MVMIRIKISTNVIMISEVHISGESQSRMTESTQLKTEMSGTSTSSTPRFICSKYDEQDVTHNIDQCERLRSMEASRDDTHQDDGIGKHAQRNSKNQIETKHPQSETTFNFNSSDKKNPDEMLMKEIRSLNDFYHDAMAGESGYGSLTMSSLGQSPPIKQSIESPSMILISSSCRHHTCSCRMGCQNFDNYDYECDDGDCSASTSERQGAVGQAQLDIVCGLKNHEPALMDKIFSNLTAQDLVRFSGVNQEWRAICEGNEETSSKKRELLQQEQEARENFKENYPKHSCPRQTVGASTPLGEVQKLGEPQASSTPAPRGSRSKYSMFVKEAKSLLADESFTKCAKGTCKSPAKLAPQNQSAECTQCGYIFCTNCREKYHGGSLCEALRCKNTAKKPHGVSSGKSKNSLRRLSRLDSSSR